MTLPDILIFMSDQHTPYYSGFYGKNTDTPAMDQLCHDGTCFTEAYTVSVFRPGLPCLRACVPPEPESSPWMTRSLI